MDKDRIKGSAKNVGGKAKETVGKVTGARDRDRRQGRSGRRQAQNAVGGAKGQAPRQVIERNSGGRSGGLIKE